MKRFERSPRAARDLAEIVAYVAADNPRAALRLADELDAKTQMLAEFPDIGQPFPERRARLSRGREYLILYRKTPHGITVLRYFHGRRDRRHL